MPSGKQEGFSEMGNSKCTFIVKPEMEIWLLIVMRSSQKNTQNKLGFEGFAD